MSLPVVVARVVGPTAGRAIAQRISAWAATANISKLSRLKAFLERHPMLTNIAGTAGVTSVIEAALSGDPASIQALNDAAAEVGINVGESVRDGVGEAAASEGKSFLERAYDAVVGNDDESVELSGEPVRLSDSDAERAQELEHFARFIRSEISGSPEFVLRHHTLMRKYLAMDAESLENLLKAY